MFLPIKYHSIDVFHFVQTGQWPHIINSNLNDEAYRLSERRKLIRIELRGCGNDAAAGDLKHVETYEKDKIIFAHSR